MQTWNALLGDAEQTLDQAGVPNPSHDARLLAAYTLNIAPMELGLRRMGQAEDSQQHYFQSLIELRACRIPLQHIVGSAHFYGIDLAVGPGVFIPRPETELLAQWAISQARAGDTIVDLCTGSGALAAALAHNVPNAKILAAEASPQAATYARRNLASTVQLKLVDVTQPGLAEKLQLEPNSVDLVVSNPPYVPENTTVDAEVRADPYQAVFSEADGMGVIRAMLPQVLSLLRPGGWFGVEHDDATAALVVEALENTGEFHHIQRHRDFNDRPRFVTAQKVVELKNDPARSRKETQK